MAYFYEDYPDLLIEANSKKIGHQAGDQFRVNDKLMSLVNIP